MPLGLGFFAAAGAGGAVLNDYELIQTFEAASNTSTVTFSNIPQSYKHLQIRHSIRSGQSGGAIQFRMRFNGVTTGTSYHSHFMSGDGSSVTRDGNLSSAYLNVGWAAGAGAGTNNHGGGIIDILDYSVTNKNKTVRCLGGVPTPGGSQIGLISSFYNSTSAITEISFATITAGEFLIAGSQGTSRFSLYGIKG
jgi:hypothetical protein